jgi:hypothetical protein
VLPVSRISGSIPFHILIGSFKTHQFGLKTDLSSIVSQKIKRGDFSQTIYDLFKNEINKQFTTDTDSVEPFATQLQNFYSRHPNDPDTFSIHGLRLPIIRTEDSFHDFINLELTIYGIISKTIPRIFKEDFENAITSGATKSGFADQGKLRAKSYDTLKEIFNSLSLKGVYIPPFLGEVQYLSQYQYDQYIFKLMFKNTSRFTTQSLIFNGEGGRIIDGVDTFNRVKELSDEDLNLFFDELKLSDIEFDEFKSLILLTDTISIKDLVLEPDIPSNKIDGASDQKMGKKTMCTRSLMSLSPHILCELVSLGIHNEQAPKTEKLYFHYIILYYSSTPKNMALLNANNKLSLPNGCIVIGIYFIQGKLSVNMCAENLGSKLGINVEEALRGEGRATSHIESITIPESLDNIRRWIDGATNPGIIDGCINYITNICKSITTNQFLLNKTKLPFCINPEIIEKQNLSAELIPFNDFSKTNKITYSDIYSALISSGKLFGDAGFCIQGSHDRHLQYYNNYNNMFESVEQSKRIASGTPDHLLYLMHLGLVLSGNGSEIFTIISKGQTSYKMWKGLVDEKTNMDVLINSGILNVLEARAVLRHILTKNPNEIGNVLSLDETDIGILRQTKLRMDGIIDDFTSQIVNELDRQGIKKMIDKFEFKRIQKCIDDVFTQISLISDENITHFTDGYYDLVIKTQENTRKKLTNYLISIQSTISTATSADIFKKMSTTPSVYPALSSELWRALEASEPYMMSDFTEFWGSYDRSKIVLSNTESQTHIGFRTFFISEETKKKLLEDLNTNPKQIDLDTFNNNTLPLLVSDDNGFGIYEEPTASNVVDTSEEDEFSEVVTEVTEMEDPQLNRVVNTEEDTDINQTAVQNSLLVVFCYDKDLKRPYTEFTTYGSKDISLLETINIKKGREVLGFIDVLRINYFGTEMLLELLNDQYNLLSIAQKKRILQVVNKQQFELANDVLSNTLLAHEYALNFMKTIRIILTKSNIVEHEDLDSIDEDEYELVEQEYNGGFNRMNKGNIVHNTHIMPNIIKPITNLYKSYPLSTQKLGSKFFIHNKVINPSLNNKTKKTHTIQKNKRSNRRIRKLGVYTHKRNRKPIIKNKRKTNRHKTKSRRSISNRK